MTITDLSSKGENIMAKRKWTPTDVSHPIEMRSNDLEFQDDKGEWHHFVVVATENRIAFGGAVNVGFLESGYLEREEGESLDVGLQEMLDDLECYYNDGPTSVSRIVFNERM